MRDEIGNAWNADLLDRMAGALGVNLQDEIDNARISRGQFDRAQLRCAACPDPEGCELWLADHWSGSMEAPALCQNKTLLERLRGSY